METAGSLCQLPVHILAWIMKRECQSLRWEYRLHSPPVGFARARGQGGSSKLWDGIWYRTRHTYLTEPGAAVWVIVYYSSTRASQGAQWESTHLPTQEAWGVRSLVREDPLEEEMATHSSSLPWRIPWTEEPGGLQSRGLQSQTQLSTYACKALKASLWDRASNPGSPTDCLISKQVTNHPWVSISSPVNMEWEMATHSSIPVWRILWMEEPGGLLSMGSHRVRHDWSDFA